MSHHKEHYWRWCSMRSRCRYPLDKSYAHYGGRGIYVCEEWHEFKAFQAWCVRTYIEGRSLDRVDNNGPYSPKNCRWATPSEQRRNSINHTKAHKLRWQRSMPKALHALKTMRTEKYGDIKIRRTKLCSRCQYKLELSHFGSNASAPDGLQGWCLDCYRGYRRG